MIDEIVYNGSTYNAEDDSWVASLIQSLEVKLKLSREKLDAIAEAVRKGIEDNIFNSREYLGGTAAPNRPMTIKRKGHGTVFFETGQLRKSVMSRNINEVEREIYIGGNRTQIAAWLQFGGKRMLPRPFFGLGEITLKKIQEIISDK